MLFSPRPLVDTCTKSGFTPLHFAAWFDRPEAVKALAVGGAKLRRRTALHGDNDSYFM